MEIKHCDFKIPTVNSLIDMPTRMSILSGIQIDNRDCEISVTTSVGEPDYVVMTEFTDNVCGQRYYKNSKKLPKKYQKYVSTLLQEHLEHFPEITLNNQGE